MKQELLLALLLLLLRLLVAAQVRMLIRELM
jgi:hypothetical protein